MAITNLWFYVTFLPYTPLWNAPWPGIDVYASSFQPGPFLAWVIPAFILPPIFLTMITSVQHWAVNKNQLCATMALVFAIIYTAVITPFYYIQMAVVPHHLANGTTDGLPLWLFSYHYPHNIFGAMEGIGYGFLSLSCILISRVFYGGKLQQWVGWTFTGLGVSVFALFINPLWPLPPVVGMIAGLAGLVLGVLAPALLAILFRRKYTSATQ